MWVDNSSTRNDDTFQLEMRPSFRWVAYRDFSQLMFHHHIKTKQLALIEHVGTAAALSVIIFNTQSQDCKPFQGEAAMKTTVFTLALAAALSGTFASQALGSPPPGKSGSSKSGSSGQSAKTVSSNNSSKGNFTVTSNKNFSSKGNPTVSSNKTGKNFNQGSSSKYSNYNQTNGTKFAHGYFYRGRDHNHWSSSRWDSRYGCECYYDPSCSSWYYWCEPACCYYPVSYCPYQTYCWTSPQASCAPCDTTTTCTEPVSVQTITRTTYVTTTTCTQPLTCASNCTPSSTGQQYGNPQASQSYGGSPQASNAPPIPAPAGPQVK
jgi:hypothetical protein